MNVEEIKVKLEFYGNLRDMVGKKEVEVVLKSSSTVLDLIKWLSEIYGKEFKLFIINPATNDLWSHFSIAVNDELVDRFRLGKKLNNGDVVKFLFPVVGG